MNMQKLRQKKTPKVPHSMIGRDNLEYSSTTNCTNYIIRDSDGNKRKVMVK